MIRLIFISIDFLFKRPMIHPRVAGLFLSFLFLGGSILISLWEVPKKDIVQSPIVTLADCDFQFYPTKNLLLRGESHSRRVLASDGCGEEAKAYSQLIASQQKVSSESAPFSDDFLNTDIASMTAGYPIELMAGSIAKYDRKVAALLIGIAKKESNWGRRVPRSDDGSDCFNYWGFKGAGSRGIAMGHGCFGSPEEAVNRVGNRIAELVQLRSTSEPKNFTIWKCGSSCMTHSDESVRKWVSDVDQYYRILASR